MRYFDHQITKELNRFIVTHFIGFVVSDNQYHTSSKAGIEPFSVWLQPLL